MAQHDYNIANQIGLEFRQDLNNLLAAVVSLNSGATAPSSTFAGMFWLDTSSSPPILKQRNQANNAWETILTSQGIAVSGASTASAQRTAMGLGSAATLTAGISANNVVQLDGTAKLPAVDGSQLTNLPIPEASTSIRQVVWYETGEYASGSTTIPQDDTIPQQTEGTQFMSASITPTAADSIIEVEVLANLDNQSGTYGMTGALFKDSNADAIAVGRNNSYFSSGTQLLLKYRETSGSTTARTFKFRAGTASAIVVAFNGYTGRLAGGEMTSYIKITEYAP